MEADDGVVLVGAKKDSVEVGGRHLEFLASNLAWIAPRLVS